MSNDLLLSLSEKDRSIMKAIVTLFYEQYNGYENKAVSQDILISLEGRGVKISDASFRAYLGLVRRNDSCRKYLKKFHGSLDYAFIVSSNAGYWWTSDYQELKEFWQSQHGRVIEIMLNVRPLYKLFGFSEEQLKLIFNEDKRIA